MLNLQNFRLVAIPLYEGEVSVCFEKRDGPNKSVFKDDLNHSGNAVRLAKEGYAPSLYAEIKALDRLDEFDEWRLPELFAGFSGNSIDFGAGERGDQYVVLTTWPRKLTHGWVCQLLPPEAALLSFRS
ncbi:MAG: hypothetical protein Kow00107_02960 [Planctomycetota bacterium]